MRTEVSSCRIQGSSCPFYRWGHRGPIHKGASRDGGKNFPVKTQLVGETSGAFGLAASEWLCPEVRLRKRPGGQATPWMASPARKAQDTSSGQQGTALTSILPGAQAQLAPATWAPLPLLVSVNKPSGTNTASRHQPQPAWTCHSCPLL